MFTQDYIEQVDRMINEGLGGGLIINDYDVKKLESPANLKTKQTTVASLPKRDTYDDIDRMINEGLGGGFIIYDYDTVKFEKPPITEDEHLIGA